MVKKSVIKPMLPSFPHVVRRSGGSDRNVLVETAEVFRENAENASAREAAAQSAALHQFAAEFRHARRGWFDRFIDGLNRLPRPLMAFGTLGLVGAAMIAPEWFSARMTGLALVPEPLWWLMGAIVSFYFGARHQAKGQEFQQALASTMVAAPSRTARRAPEPAQDDNPALNAWRAQHGA